MKKSFFNLRLKRNIKLSFIAVVGVFLIAMTSLFSFAYNSNINNTESNTYANLLHESLNIVSNNDLQFIMDEISSLKDSIETCPDLNGLCSDLELTRVYVCREYGWIGDDNSGWDWQCIDQRFSHEQYVCHSEVLDLRELCFIPDFAKATNYVAQIANDLSESLYNYFKQINLSQLDSSLCENKVWSSECFAFTPGQVREINTILINASNRIAEIYDEELFSYLFWNAGFYRLNHRILDIYRTFSEMDSLGWRRRDERFISYETLQRIYEYKLERTNDHYEAMYLTAQMFLDSMQEYAEEYLMYLIKAEQSGLNYYFGQVVRHYVACEVPPYWHWATGNYFITPKSWYSTQIGRNCRDATVTDVVNYLWGFGYNMPLDHFVGYPEAVMALHLGLLDCLDERYWVSTDFMDIVYSYCTPRSASLSELIPASAVLNNPVFRHRLSEIFTLKRDDLFDYFYDATDRRRYLFNFFERKEIQIDPSDLHEYLAKLKGNAFAINYDCSADYCIVSFYETDNLEMPRALFGNICASRE